MTKFDIKRYSNGIVTVRTRNQSSVCKTFMRVQEFYENPLFKGNLTLTINDIESWWREHHSGTEKYEEYWGGFNIPGPVFRQFFLSSASLPHTKHENDLLNQLDRSNLLDINYIIAGFGNETGKMWKDLLKHEFAHAYFYTDITYKNEMTKLVENLPKPAYKNVSERLLEMGYDESVLIDEIQAYFATGLENRMTGYEHLTVPFQEIYNNKSKVIS